MPLGVIFDAFAVLLGGIVGSLMGNRMDSKFKETMNGIMGCCSMCIGIAAIVLMKNMPAVVLSIIVGTVLGLFIHLGEWIRKGGMQMEKGISKIIKSKSNVPAEEAQATLITCITLFCASGTGIYGAMTAGMIGDHSILIAKGILDFVTAIIFGCSIGYVAAMVAIPQFLIFLLLYMCAGLIYPYCTPTMIQDFKAVGGFIMLATGFRMCSIKMFPVADMIPAMIIAMPISAFWTNCIAPFVEKLATL